MLLLLNTFERTLALLGSVGLGLVEFPGVFSDRIAHDRVRLHDPILYQCELMSITLWSAPAIQNPWIHPSAPLSALQREF